MIAPNELLNLQLSRTDTNVPSTVITPSSTTTLVEDMATEINGSGTGNLADQLQALATQQQIELTPEMQTAMTAMMTQLITQNTPQPTATPEHLAAPKPNTNPNQITLTSDKDEDETPNLSLQTS